jgi:trehalose/maltose hydrolase-like predicted phosphorylase
MQHSEMTPGPPAHDQPPAMGPSAAVTGHSKPGVRPVVLAEITPDPSWLLTEDGFTLAREHEIESLFSIANGYVGNRGSLAEGSPLSAPASFLAGVFEKSDAPGSVPGLFVMPDWTGVRAWVEGQALSMEQGQILQHRRILDMRRGILWREWRHRDPNGRITNVLAFRLTSLTDRHLLIQSVVFCPENYSGDLSLENSIVLAPEVLASPPPEDWKTRRNATRPNILPLGLKCPGSEIVVGIAAASQLVAHDRDAGTRAIDITDRRVTERFRIDVEIGAEYRLDKLVSMYSARESDDPVEEAVAQVSHYFPSGLRTAVANHVAEWEHRWHTADIRVTGDEVLQKALRFSEYHLISAANPEDDRVSIGARALTGEAYKGHVFWDTEIYMLPFYTLTHPASARALLMYRYHTLPAARRKAQSAGYRGAMYPWESADTGDEATPRFVIDPKGQVIEVLNGEMEIHITADVAYAVWQYWDATADESFLLSAGAEILLETARFWASRGEIEKDGHYHIRHVIGPDEYHENVDDSAYTNLMAAWNLRRGAETVSLLQQRWPERWDELSSYMHIGSSEVAGWTRLAEAMYVPFDPKTRLFEQFERYYDREPIELKSYEPRHAAMDVILGHERIQHTNVVKQADVVMAMYLLWNEFPPGVREANFRYYEPRTGHGSSLSPSMHALVAARMGDLSLAERYLKQAAEIDLGNNMGNAAGGVHAAAIGGLWQAIVFGFAGLELTKDGLNINPRLLPAWRNLSLPIQWRGTRVRFVFEPDRVRLRVEEGNNAVKVTMAGGANVIANVGRQYQADRLSNGWTEWRAV